MIIPIRTRVTIEDDDIFPTAKSVEMLDLTVESRTRIVYDWLKQELAVRRPKVIKVILFRLVFQIM